MKYLTFLSLVFSSTALGFVVLPTEQQQHVFGGRKNAEAVKATSQEGFKYGYENEWRLIQTSPGETKWVTEEEKLKLKRAKINFMDITEFQDLGFSQYTAAKKEKPTFPKAPKFQKLVHPILKNLTTVHMETNLREFTAFHTRYYMSKYGAESSKWLQARVEKTAPGVIVEPFKHLWPQNSLIAIIPGKSEKTVVIGAHQDSINLYFPSLLSAPGADDDGSGTVTILEALRAITSSEYYLANGGFENTLEFHWYSAEEGGLLGSQAIFSSYEKAGREVVAMLQQDMTGFVKRTLAAGKPESVGVITDYVDPGLTEFIKAVIDEYCDIQWVETKCGYACSDHASASKAGYASAFVIESEFDLSDNKIHTVEDKIEELSFDHMKQHAKLTVGLALELAMTKFD